MKYCLKEITENKEKKEKKGKRKRKEKGNRWFIVYQKGIFNINPLLKILFLSKKKGKRKEIAF